MRAPSVRLKRVVVSTLDILKWHVKCHSNSLSGTVSHSVQLKYSAWKCLDRELDYNPETRDDSAVR